MEKTAKFITILLLGAILIISLWTGANFYTALKSESPALEGDMSFFDKVQTAIDFTDTQFSASIPGKTAFIEAHGLFQRLALKSYVQDAAYDRSIIKDNHGKLHFKGWMYAASQFQPAPLLESYAAFHAHLSQEGIPLLYIATPEKYIKGYTSFPPTLENFSNENLEVFLAGLDEAGLPYWDLRRTVSQPASDKAGLFYITDHHWTSQGSFLGFVSILDALEEIGLDLDSQDFYRNPENYTREDYPQSFVGSQGRRVGRYYTAVDDFTLIYPNFPTEFSFIVNDNPPREGDFRSAFIYEEHLEPEDVYANKYAAYLGGDYAQATLQNHLQPQHKLLIIKDSFTNPAAAFLANCVGEIKLIDLRYYTDSLYELAEEYQPDAVIVLYNSSSISRYTFGFDGPLE